MKINVISIVFFSCFVLPSHAQNNENDPLADVKRRMALNANVECSLVESSYTDTEDEEISSTDEYIFENLKPQASSTSDFAIWSLFWENQDYKFYYFMNSQVGEIRILDKKTQQKVETDLDIFDMDKENPISGQAARLVKLGEVRSISSSQVKAKSPKTGDLVEATKTKTLHGFCYRMK